MSAHEIFGRSDTERAARVLCTHQRSCGKQARPPDIASVNTCPDEKKSSHRRHNLFGYNNLRRVQSSAARDHEQRGGALCHPAVTRWSAHDNGEELLAALGGCFDALGDRAQLALDMRFRERSSRNEIADALKMSEHGAKNLMQRAKKRLRECVDRKMTTDAD